MPGFNVSTAIETPRNPFDVSTLHQDSTSGLQNRRLGVTGEGAAKQVTESPSRRHLTTGNPVRLPFLNWRNSMRNLRTGFVALLALAFLVDLAAAEPPDPNDGQPRDRQGGPGGPRRGHPGDRGPGRPFGGEGFIERILSFDQNKDGKVSKDELPERMQRIFDRADTNKDGALDKDELKKMVERFRQIDRRGRPGEDGRGGRPGDGDRRQRPKPPQDSGDE